MAGMRAMVEFSNHEEHFELFDHEDGDQFAPDQEMGDGIYVYIDDSGNESSVAEDESPFGS